MSTTRSGVGHVDARPACAQARRARTVGGGAGRCASRRGGERRRRRGERARGGEDRCMGAISSSGHGSAGASAPLRSEESHSGTSPARARRRRPARRGRRSARLDQSRYAQAAQNSERRQRVERHAERARRAGSRRRSTNSETPVEQEEQPEHRRGVLDHRLEAAAGRGAEADQRAARSRPARGARSPACAARALQRPSGAEAAASRGRTPSRARAPMSIVALIEVSTRPRRSPDAIARRTGRGRARRRSAATALDSRHAVEPEAAQVAPRSRATYSERDEREAPTQRAPRSPGARRAARPRCTPPRSSRRR